MQEAAERVEAVLARGKNFGPTARTKAPMQENQANIKRVVIPNAQRDLLFLAAATFRDSQQIPRSLRGHGMTTPITESGYIFISWPSR